MTEKEMNLDRVKMDVANAAAQFTYVELHRRNDLSLFVKVALQTSVGSIYVASIELAGYPTTMPQVRISKPSLDALTPHRYKDGQICFLHPTMWNPGRHDVVFVIARTAKWLNKYEIWRRNGRRWPGAELKH